MPYITNGMLPETQNQNTTNATSNGIEENTKN